MSMLDYICEQPWLVTSAGFNRIMRDAQKRDALKPGATSFDIIVESPRTPSALDDNGIAHINICGIIGHRLSWIEKALGNTDVCDVRREVDAATEVGANAIFMHVDSPGGTVAGTCELADTLAELNQQIPIFAFSDNLIASAAYWISASARQIWTSPSAEIGSIGILFPWIDKSAAWEQIGIKFEPITNTDGIYKSAGHGPSLTPEQREDLQSRMDRTYSLFQSFVTQRRPQIDSSVMQGQVKLGIDAPSYGLTDFVGTMKEAYSALCLEAAVFPMNIDLGESLPITFQNGLQFGSEKKTDS